jgi:hypothetical protein
VRVCVCLLFYLSFQRLFFSSLFNLFGSCWSCRRSVTSRNKYILYFIVFDNQKKNILLTTHKCFITFIIIFLNFKKLISHKFTILIILFDLINKILKIF